MSTNNLKTTAHEVQDRCPTPPEEQGEDNGLVRDPEQDLSIRYSGLKKRLGPDRLPLTVDTKITEAKGHDGHPFTGFTGRGSATTPGTPYSGLSSVSGNSFGSMRIPSASPEVSKFSDATSGNNKYNNSSSSNSNRYQESSCLECPQSWQRGRLILPTGEDAHFSRAEKRMSIENAEFAPTPESYEFEQKQQEVYREQERQRRLNWEAHFERQAKRLRLRNEATQCMIDEEKRQVQEEKERRERVNASVIPPGTSFRETGPLHGMLSSFQCSCCECSFHLDWRN
jgi:hypothetical protein